MTFCSSFGILSIVVRNTVPTKQNMRKCRNWQTSKTKDLVMVTSCGFKSHLPHIYLKSAGWLHIIKNAGVAELADAQASGACGRKIVWVQVPSPAFFFCYRLLSHKTHKNPSLFNRLIPLITAEEDFYI